MPAKTLDDLPEDCYILIQKTFDGYNFDYVDNNHLFYKINNKLLGGLTIDLDKKSIAKNIYNVTWAKTISGFGPLLYHIAMEFVTKITNGEGYLKSDPGGVTDDAERIWNHFDKNDSSVNKKQLDSLENELTPPVEDNVDQAFVKSQYRSEWPKSSLSRGFNKKSINLLDHPKIIYKLNENKIKNIRIKNVKK